MNTSAIYDSESYEILGAKFDDSIAEIKRKFRKKAKKLHPDTNPKGVTAFLRLRHAYEAIIKERTHTFFTSNSSYNFYRPAYKKDAFDYRQWLLDRGDNESMAKLIFYDLMKGKEDEAVSRFLYMNTQYSDFDLQSWFEAEDFMDMGFILAEELVFRKEYYDAALILCKIILLEQKRPYFRLFFPEVLAMAKDVLLTKLEGNVSDELCLDCWENALDLCFDTDTRQAISNKIVQAYLRLGDAVAATKIMRNIVQNI